jgi:hypothetical protein
LQFGNIQNPEIRSPTDDNGWIVVGENIEPKWCEGDILPPKLADILEQVEENEEDADGDNSSIDSDDELSWSLESDSDCDEFIPLL